MGNRIQLRHGSSTPTTTNLLPYELGWDGSTLYIHNGDAQTPSIIALAGSSAYTSSAYTNNTTSIAITTGTTIPTVNTIYHGLPYINNSHTYTDNTTIYAPTSAGTANQILVSAGGTSAPTWTATSNGAAYATSTNGALTFGALPIAQGGTGATSASAALTNLGLSNVVLSDQQSRKIYLSNTASVPSGASPGDIVLVKIT